MPIAFVNSLTPRVTDSVLSKVAFQKWALDDTPEEKSELTNLLKTLTRQQDSKDQMKLKCEGCELESDFCNCTLNVIMFENTFQVRLTLFLSTTVFKSINLNWLKRKYTVECR